MIVSVQGVEMTISPPGNRIGMQAVRTKHQIVNVYAPVTEAQSGAGLNVCCNDFLAVTERRSTMFSRSDGVNVKPKLTGHWVRFSTNSTRRFSACPSAVSLVDTGLA
jgi:hypothetical protein